VLHTMLDVLEVLSTSLNTNPNVDNSAMLIPNTPYSLQFMDNMESREVCNYLLNFRKILCRVFATMNIDTKLFVTRLYFIDAGNSSRLC